MRSKTKLILVLSSIIAISIVSYYWLFIKRSDDISNTLTRFMQTQKTPKYTINKSVTSLGTDSSGEWWLTLDTEFTTEMVEKKSMGIADNADTAYMIDVLSDSLNSGITKENNAILHRGGAVLGEDTICSRFHCNTYMLAKVGSKDIYVGIYKD